VKRTNQHLSYSSHGPREQVFEGSRQPACIIVIDLAHSESHERAADGCNGCDGVRMVRFEGWLWWWCRNGEDRVSWFGGCAMRCAGSVADECG